MLAGSHVHADNAAILLEPVTLSISIMAPRLHAQQFIACVYYTKYTHTVHSGIAQSGPVQKGSHWHTSGLVKRGGGWVGGGGGGGGGGAEEGKELVYRSMK